MNKVIEELNIRNINIPGDIVISESGKLMKSYFEYQPPVSYILDIYNHWVQTILPKQLDQVNIKFADYTIKFSNPVTYKPSILRGGSRVSLYPKTCREIGKTYAFDLYVNVRVIKDSQESVIQNVFLGRIPSMLRSVTCHLHGKTEEELLKLGECNKDPFGYFIIKGNEKLVVIHEKLRTNRFFIFNDNKTGEPICKITTDNGLGVTRNITIFQDKFKSIRLNQNMFGKDKTISILFPYRYLIGIDVSYQEMLSMILIFVNKKHWNKVREIFNGTYVNYLSTLSGDESLITDKANSNNYDDKRDYLSRELFFHMQGMAEINKAYLLSLIIARYMEYLAGGRELDDRDNWGNKALITAGQDMAILFNKILKYLAEHISSKLERESAKLKMLARPEITNAVKSAIDSSFITEQFENSFNSSKWGIKSEKTKENVTDYLKREGSLLSIYSQLTRVKTPTNKQMKQPTVRQVQMSQLGYVDPVESPEGENCGLVKHLATTAYITRQIDDTLIIKRIKLYNRYDEKLAALVVNGRFIGWCESTTRAELVKLRRENAIPRDTCIVLDKSAGEEHQVLYIYTDSGRVVRPLLIVNPDLSLVLDRNNLRDKPFTELVSNGAVEFIDAWEQINLVISPSIDILNTVRLYPTLDDIIKRRNELESLPRNPKVEYELDLINRVILEGNIGYKYTHCELDPNAILGYSASLIPLINYNQGPRNSFQCNMGKQALGIYHSNYLVRFDNQVKVLAFPTRPILETQMAKWIGLNQLPAGEMVMLAIMTYSGFNQEDAIIINKGSIDRGRFKMVVYRRYRAVFKSISSKSGYIEKLAKPVPKPGEKIDRYQNLDNNGIAILGSYVKSGDVIIGKVRQYSTGEVDYSLSVTVGVSEEGVVDRVLVTTNSEGNLTVMVRIREVRDPIVGDKFASRYAQKATIGLIVNEVDMPFTLNGSRPDIIINPHCIPSRMTMGKILEIVSSKAGALRGEFINGTSFNYFNINEFIRILKQYGYHESGGERMIDGRTGEMYPALIMFGPCYYQALRHHVKDKYFSRSGFGKISSLTRAPIGRRQLGGALRVGEMERDAFINHGASGVLLDRLCLSSDAYRAIYCKQCGKLAIFNIFQKKYTCKDCKSEDVGYCVIPYIFKILVDYLAAAGINIRVRFKPESEIVSK